MQKGNSITVEQKFLINSETVYFSFNLLLNLLPDQMLIDTNDLILQNTKSGTLNWILISCSIKSDAFLWIGKPYRDEIKRIETTGFVLKYVTCSGETGNKSERQVSH